MHIFALPYAYGLMGMYATQTMFGLFALAWSPGPMKEEK